MDIAIHLGAHLTDDGRLRSCLEKNRATLAREGIEVPDTGRFRTPILDAVKTHSSDGISADAGAILLDSIVSQDTTERLVMSSTRFLSPLPSAVRRAQFCAMAEARVAGLRALFADHHVSFYMAIRNPASFLRVIVKSGVLGSSCGGPIWG